MARMKTHLAERFDTTGLTERVGDDHFFPTVDEAVAWCRTHRNEGDD